ncbi:lung seven transmembrane receptor-domain-containing protein [Globomyces pollinis-pini]|nr:lung seven transmembrane receptor-domain-containing protein [Globomyces pollinis-pini]
MVKKGQCLESELGAFHLIKNSTTPVLNQNVKWGVQKNTSSSLTEEILPSSIEIPENTNNVNSNSSKLSSDGAIHSRLSNHDEKLKQLSSITHRSIGSVPVDPKLIKIKYNVEVSSLYCIYISSSTQEDVRDFTTNFILTNPYGLLPAIFYPSLPFYATMSVLYSIIGVSWMIVSFMHWRQLLPIQHYVSGVIAFLVVEMAFNYGFFENYNETGEISKSLLTIMAILNAARTSLSLFMLLIVSLGYGVVKPTLGTTMNRCLALAGSHFFFNVLYAIGTLMSDDVNSNPVFLLTLPLSFTMTIFYMWIMGGLNDTMQHLETRRQIIKLTMYKRLWWILASTIFGTFGILIANSINISHRNEESWIINQWKWRWMLLDGSLNILFFITFVSVAYLWMPTTNNERYGLDQIATDEEDFYDAPTELQPQDNENMKSRIGKNYQTSEYDEDDTADDDDILAWAEENVVVDSTPKPIEDQEMIDEKML